MNESYGIMPSFEKQTYRLIIDTDLYSYIMQLAQQALPNEITGIGMVAKKCHGYHTDFVVEDVRVPKQYVSPDLSSFEEGALNKIIEEMLQEGDDVEKLCFRWHSHADGAVFFSHIDENDIDRCGSPYVVNLVVNARYEMLARLDILEPVRVRGIPLSVVIEPIYDEELIAECKADVTGCCKPMPSKKFEHHFKEVR